MSVILPPIFQPHGAADLQNDDEKLSPLDRSWRTKGTAATLLKLAHNKIEEAARVIAAQSKRIQGLEDIASTDPLTGLINRRGFEQFFDAERARIRRGNSPGALIVLIDLDRFKPINDHHGHPAGDACLKLVAQILLNSIRITDGAARFGGDEFALLLTHTDPQAAQVRVEQLRKSLNEMTLEWGNEKLIFGASLGTLPVSAHSEYLSSYQGVDMTLNADKKKRRAER